MSQDYIESERESFPLQNMQLDKRPNQLEPVNQQDYWEGKEFEGRFNFYRPDMEVGHGDKHPAGHPMMAGHYGMRAGGWAYIAYALLVTVGELGLMGALLAEWARGDIGPHVQVIWTQGFKLLVSVLFVHVGINVYYFLFRPMRCVAWHKFASQAGVSQFDMDHIPFGPQKIFALLSRLNKGDGVLGLVGLSQVGLVVVLLLYGGLPASMWGMTTHITAIGPGAKMQFESLANCSVGSLPMVGSTSHVTFCPAVWRGMLESGATARLGNDSCEVLESLAISTEEYYSIGRDGVVVVSGSYSASLFVALFPMLEAVGGNAEIRRLAQEPFNASSQVAICGVIMRATAALNGSNAKFTVSGTAVAIGLVSAGLGVLSVVAMIVSVVVNRGIARLGIEAMCTPLGASRLLEVQRVIDTRGGCVYPNAFYQLPLNLVIGSKERHVCLGVKDHMEPINSADTYAGHVPRIEEVPSHALSVRQTQLREQGLSSLVCGTVGVPAKALPSLKANQVILVPILDAGVQNTDPTLPELARLEQLKARSGKQAERAHSLSSGLKECCGRRFDYLCMPNGSGRAHLRDSYRWVVDIDDLASPRERDHINACHARQNKMEVDRMRQHILRKHADWLRTKVVLLHSPDEAPPGSQCLCIKPLRAVHEANIAKCSPRGRYEAETQWYQLNGPRVIITGDNAATQALAEAFAYQRLTKGPPGEVAIWMGTDAVMGTAKEVCRLLALRKSNRRTSGPRVVWHGTAGRTGLVNVRGMPALLEEVGKQFGEVTTELAYEYIFQSFCGLTVHIENLKTLPTVRTVAKEFPPPPAIQYSASMAFQSVRPYAWVLLGKTMRIIGSAGLVEELAAEFETDSYVEHGLAVIDTGPPPLWAV